MPWLLLSLALAAQAPEVEDYFDRQAPAADRIDAIDLGLADRIVRFPRRTDSIALTVRGGVASIQAPPMRSVRWTFLVGFALAFDAFLVPAPRALGAPRVERERRARCLALLVRPLPSRELAARIAALGCAS